jgi:hypothetical protein
MINEVEGFVALYSQVDSIQFGDGSFDGLVKVIELTSKLNDLENKVNSMISVFNAHIHTATGFRSTPKTLLSAMYIFTFAVPGDNHRGKWFAPSLFALSQDRLWQAG